MRTRDILRKAANIIEAAGWTYGVLARDSGDHYVEPTNVGATCFCAIGAMCRAVDTPYREDVRVKRAMQRFAEFLQANHGVKNPSKSTQTLDPNFYMIYTFNDGQERTEAGKANVVAALRKCANTYGRISK